MTCSHVNSCETYQTKKNLQSTAVMTIFLKTKLDDPRWHVFADDDDDHL